MITSAGAVEVYDLTPDTVPKLSLMASGYEVAVASSEAQMSELLAKLGLGVSSPNQYTLAYWLNQIRANTREIANAFVSGSGLFFSDGYYLDSDGDSFYGMSSLSITDILQRGLLGLSENIKSLSSSFDLSSLVTAVNTNTTAVNAVTTAVNNNKSAVDLVSSAVNGTTTAVNGTTAAVEDTTSAIISLSNFLSSQLLTPNARSYLSMNGVSSTTSGTMTFETLYRNASLGIASLLRTSSGIKVLNQNGLVVDSSVALGVDSVLSYGFSGLANILNGSFSSSNMYTGTLIDNENQLSMFSVDGIGPMISAFLQEIQHDSGLLTYIFASPEDIEMKENSSSTMGAVNDSFIDSDSDTSVSVSDIGTLSSAAGSIESFGSTGVTPDQAFAQLGNDSIFEFFSQTTAYNLDSRPSSYSLRDPAPQIVTNYYSESRAEFFNLIGEGSE